MITLKSHPHAKVEYKKILIDILEPDPVFGQASKQALRRCLQEGSVIACEVSSKSIWPVSQNSHFTFHMPPSLPLSPTPGIRPQISGSRNLESSIRYLASGIRYPGPKIRHLV
jgi:hypothetical protein